MSNIQYIPIVNLPNNNIQFGSQINNPINNNLFYESQINELKRQLNEEKNKNQILFNENLQLKQKINNLNVNITNYTNQIMLLQNELLKYKNNFTNTPINYSITSIKPGEKIMAINFVSMGIQEIGHYALACKNTDLFVRLEEQLNNDFPQLKNHETYFMVNAKRIKRFKTLDENKIKNKDIINIFIMDS